MRAPLVEAALWPASSAASVSLALLSGDTGTGDSPPLNITFDFGRGTASVACGGAQAAPAATASLGARAFVNAWNLVRVVALGGRVLVYFNPQYPDVVRATGGRGAADLDVRPLAPLLNASVAAACPAAAVVAAHSVEVVARGPGRKGDAVIAALDYFSVQPAANL